MQNVHQVTNMFSSHQVPGAGGIVVGGVFEDGGEE